MTEQQQAAAERIEKAIDLIYMSGMYTSRTQALLRAMRADLEVVKAG